MCGILGAINFDENKAKAANNDILNMFQDQRTRGTEGFGIVMIQANGDYAIKRSTNEIKAVVDLYMEEAAMIFMHHRAPTSTENKINQTHPILVDNKLLEFKYLVIHNGIIHNDNRIKLEHEKEGFVYTTECMEGTVKKFNDSETLAIEVAKFIENKTKEIAATGSASFIALQIVKETNKVDKVFFGRNTNPLKLGMSRGKIRLSSEGQGEDIKINTMYNFNLGDFKLHKQNLIFATYKSAYSSQPYSRMTDDDWEVMEGYGYIEDRGCGRLHTTCDRGGFAKNTEPKNLPITTGSAFDNKNLTALSKPAKTEEEIDEEIDYELAIEETTEEFTTEVEGIIQQYIDDLKDEREIFMVEPKDFMAQILAEMYKVRDVIEKLTSLKMMIEAEKDKDLPPADGKAQE